MRTWSVRHIPPDQLLRQAFEQCRTFADAKQHLETVPVARPAIYTLVGCRPGERCVIERTEETHSTRHETTSAANDWLVRTDPWEARIGGELTLTCSYAEAGDRSHARRHAISEWRGSFAGDSFAWVDPAGAQQVHAPRHRDVSGRWDPCGSSATSAPAMPSGRSR